jgi:transcriptional regulator with XRE-family HTH domain
MPSITRRMSAADQRAEQLLVAIGRELKAARQSRGLSQRTIAAATNVDQAEISLIERGKRAGLTTRSLARLAAAVGLELSVRLFPAGEPIRDKAHATLLERFRKAVGERWEWAAEVPLPIPGDKRAWDRLLRVPGVVIGAEGETRPTDMQELQRRLALKKRDGKVDRLVRVLADTEWCRRIVRLNDIETMFPVPGKVALRALAEARDPGGDAIVLV